MKLTTDRLHDNGATHWVVEDLRPIVGGRYVVYIAAPDGEVGLDEVRAVAWSTDDLEAVRGIVVADRFTDRARGFATGVRVQLIDASGVRGQTLEATADIEDPTDAKAGEPEPIPPFSTGCDVADQLVQSQTYLAQRARAGRSALDDETVITIVRAATNRGGRTTTGLLALRLMTSVANVRSRVASLRRLLNVDGYEIVAYDDESGTVTVDGDLLRAQFALTGPSAKAPTGTVVPPYVQSIRSLPKDLDAS
jgi:hypothetical protein